MDYKLFQTLPIELCEKIYNFIDFQVPGAVAIKTAPIREIKLNELFSISPPKGEPLKLYSSDDDLDDEWEDFQENEEYWEGFYAAHGIGPDGFL